MSSHSWALSDQRAVVGAQTGLPAASPLAGALRSSSPSLAAISPWDAAWQAVLPETASRVRADYRWDFFLAWLMLSLALVTFIFQRIFVEQLHVPSPVLDAGDTVKSKNQLWSFPLARHSSNNHTNGCNMATVE